MRQVKFVLLLFIILRLVAVGLLIVVKHYFVLLLDTESTWGVNKKGRSIKGLKYVDGISSSIRDRIKSTGNSASIDDFCIIDNVGNELDLLIHESLLILRDGPTLNQQKFLDTPLLFLIPIGFLFWFYLVLTSLISHYLFIFLLFTVLPYFAKFCPLFSDFDYP